MTNELSPATRALLDLAREGMSPDAASLRRVRGKIDAAVGGAAVGSAIAVKLSLLTVAAVVLAGAIAIQRDDEATMPILSLGSSASMTETQTTHVHEAAPPPQHIEMEIEAPRPRAARVVEAVSAPRVEAAAPPAITLAREVELVDDAMAALRKGDPTTALASVRIHREETRGAGQLAEDAAAIEIEALCKLHDRRVVAKLEAFDAHWPESAQRSRLSTNCF